MLCNVVPKRYNYETLVCYYDLIAAEGMQDSILSISRDVIESKEKLYLETCWIANEMIGCKGSQILQLVVLPQNDLGKLDASSSRKEKRHLED